MNKKAATTRELIQKIGYLFLVVIIIVFIFVVVFDHLNLDIDTISSQHAILSLNLINSPTCLAYEDPILGVQAGKIDVEKLTDGRLQKCLNKTKTDYRVFLYNEKKEIVKRASKMSRNMESQIPVCAVNRNYFRCTINTNYILYNTVDGFKPGFIVTEVITNVQ